MDILQSRTTASVAHTVEVAEATWVLYFFKSLLRVESSIIQELLVGMIVVPGWEAVDDVKGACSEFSSRVIPGNGESAACEAPWCA